MPAPRVVAPFVVPLLAPVLLALACGGPASPAATPAPAPAPAPAAPGTSGFPGLDWGADLAAIQAAYPAATEGGPGAQLSTTHEGRAATIQLALDGGLGRITVTFDEIFASMDACGTAFAPVRRALDARLGASSEENLAAYWETATATVTLACSPGDGEDAVLAITHEPRPAD